MQYVINDDYVEFRKALAEGKTIQYRNLNINGFKNWQNLENLKFNPNFEHRIKPELPKFKVGDWVIHNGVYKQVTKAVDGLIDSLDNQVVVIMKEESLELWEPKEGDWCWFHNGNKQSLIFSKFKGMTDLNHMRNLKGSTELYLIDHCEDMTFLLIPKMYKYCEPFIGNYPTCLKDINAE